MRFCLLLPVAILLACGPDEPGWDGSVQPLGNGGVRVSNPEVGIWPEGQGWTLEPELRIGRTDGDGADVFARIEALELDGARRIWLIEGQAREVRVFDTAGAHVRTFGRQGGGPGEFQRPGGLLLDPEGNMWIPDAGSRRYARFDTTGRLLETRPLDTRALRFTFVGTMTPDGQLWDIDMSPPREGEPAVSPLMAAAGLGGGREFVRAVLRTDGGPVGGDTIPVPGLDDPPGVFSVPGMALGVPFTPRVHWNVTPRGVQWVGTSDAYRVVRRTFGGDTTHLIERVYEPLPVSDPDIEAWMQQPGPQRILQAGGSIDRSRIPRMKPIFDDLLEDDAGFLWVRMVRDEPGTTFDVFDPDGRYLGAVSTPDDIARLPRPLIRGAALYAVVRDELDVQSVVRYRIEGR